MKHVIKILILNISLFFCQNIIAQKPKDILITGIHSCYLNNEPINFYVKNNRFHIKYYLLIGVQKKIKNKWITVLRDIERTDFTKTDHITILDSNAAVEATWIPMNSPQFGKKKKITGEFRFILSFGVTPSELNEVISGNSFYVK